MNRHLVFQAYGRADIINELRYCVHSLYKIYNGNVPFTVTVYTDSADILGKELPSGVKYSPLSAELLKEWAGEINFVHRVKVKMLQHFCLSHEGTVLYMDTDTVVEKPLEPLFELVELGNYLMHIREGRVSDRQNLMFKKINGFLSSNPQFGITNKVVIWNAGVLGFKTDESEMLEEVLSLTDRMFAKYHKHIMEQMAFSFALAKRKPILPADDHIYHYWNFKEFRAVLADFFRHYSSASFELKTSKTGIINPRVLIEPKLRYEKLPSIVRSIRKIFRSTWALPEYKLD